MSILVSVVLFHTMTDTLLWDLPGAVLAAPASALCGWKGVLTPGGPRARCNTSPSDRPLPPVILSRSLSPVFAIVGSCWPGLATLCQHINFVHVHVSMRYSLVHGASLLVSILFLLLLYNTGATHAHCPAYTRIHINQGGKPKKHL